MQLPPCTFQSNFTLQLTCLAKVCKCTTWLCLEKYNQCKCDISMITGNAKKCLEGHFAHFSCPMLQIACGHTDRLHIRLDTQSLLCLLPRSSQNSSWFYMVSWDTWGLRSTHLWVLQECLLYALNSSDCARQNLLCDRLSQPTAEVCTRIRVVRDKAMCYFFVPWIRCRYISVPIIAQHTPMVWGFGLTDPDLNSGQMVDAFIFLQDHKADLRKLGFCSPV